MSRAGLVERFSSVQGEGRNAGRPAYFVRFSGCNLDCMFADGSICDTPWRSANEKLTVTEIVDTAREAYVIPSNECMEDRPMLVITGGEPTMQPMFDDLVLLAGAAGFYVAVETNGTRYKTSLRLCDWVTVSPKDMINHINPLDEPVLNSDVLELMHWKPGEFRYVIGPGDLSPPWYPAMRHYVSPAVMADGTGTEHLTGFPGFVPGAVDACLAIVATDSRWRLSLQTHKFLGVR